jgi:dynein heavy chain
MDPLSLQTWLQRNAKQIDHLIFHVRSNLSELHRCIIVALITTDVHARDIIEELEAAKVQTTNDFNWVKQLRYYYDEEAPYSATIKQISACLNYGGEYMGATSRLVITPLTDKCWITITGALHIKLGANPAGPAGTGKTESTMDLAKASATLCIVFNCSDQVDYILMGTLFMGLAQGGAWACLDEFNRIRVEVLSVIAQQLLQIRKALLSYKVDDPKDKFYFKFEEKEIPICTEFGCHITMNPGYAGRTELPDNLKILFRPVSMMIPDYALIAEIMLSAEGFGNSKPLSKKMVQLYGLSSQQLSQQDHYDFGMRAVKSVLVMAGALKRANPNTEEDAVLIRAMRDANVPKFLKDDLPLFAAIVQDLFPTVQIQESDYTELNKQITKSIRDLGFQPKPEFITKVIFLLETFNVRFGVMLVGPTGGGKTTCYEVLAHVMTEFRNNNHPDKTYQVVNKKIFNPKAITMGELYGEVDFISQDWTDGLASKIIRAASQEQGEERSWTVFDGPVDALWIENMNTVLDDNMTLCLSNGQRIKLRPQMRMLFEVNDLKVASPATVSRCGMVYLTAEQLGWVPYFDTWMEKNFPDEEVLSADEKEHIRETFLATIDTGTEKIRTQFTEPVKTDNLQLVKGTLNFMEVFYDPAKGFNQTDPKARKKDIDSIMAFSYAWGMGAALDERSKDFFDTFIKDNFKSAQFPQQFTVYDYYYDLKKSKNWMPWDNQVQKFEYIKDMSYFDMMVPTADTYKTRFALE